MANEVINNLLAWQLVKELVRKGSISEAAVVLDLDSSKASRLLKSLEDELAFPLFDRTSRPFGPTGDCLKILNNLESLLGIKNQLFKNCQRIRSNTNQCYIRFGVGTGTDANFMVRCVEEYSKVNPEIQIALADHASIEELENGLCDVAYLPHYPVSPDFTCMATADVYNFPVATPEYISKFGSPMMPEDLSEHCVIRKKKPLSVQQTVLWRHRFFKFFEAKEVLYLDDRFALQAVLESKGIALELPLGQVESYLKKQLLVPVLNDWHVPCRHCCLVCKSSLISEISSVGNFLAWFGQKLKDFEDQQWKTIYKEQFQKFPIWNRPLTEETQSEQ